MMNLVPKLNLTIIPLVCCLVLAISHTVTSEPNIGVSSYVCNGNSYAQGDPFGDSVTYVLFDMMNVTPSRDGFNYYTYSPYAVVAYGHATCSIALSANDCADCLTSAKAFLENRCGGRIGGQTQLVDCFMRFENYSFW